MQSRLVVRLGFEFAPLPRFFPSAARALFANSLGEVKETLKRALERTCRYVDFFEDFLCPTAVIVASSKEIERQAKSEVARAVVAISWARWKLNRNFWEGRRVDKPKRMFVVMRVYEWESIFPFQPLYAQAGRRCIKSCGFLPVFDSREKAEAVAAKCGANIIEVELTFPKRQENTRTWRR